MMVELLAQNPEIVLIEWVWNYWSDLVASFLLGLYVDLLFPPVLLPAFSPSSFLPCLSTSLLSYFNWFHAFFSNLYSPPFQPLFPLLPPPWQLHEPEHIPRRSMAMAYLNCLLQAWKYMVDHLVPLTTSHLSRQFICSRSFSYRMFKDPVKYLYFYHTQFHYEPGISARATSVNPWVISLV